MIHSSYTSWSFPHAWLIIGFVVTRLTRRVPLEEQELFTLPEDLRSSPAFIGVPVTRSLVLCVCFVDRCLSICPVSFWLLCCLSIFDLHFWLPLNILKRFLYVKCKELMTISIWYWRRRNLVVYVFLRTIS